MKGDLINLWFWYFHPTFATTIFAASPAYYRCSVRSELSRMLYERINIAKRILPSLSMRCCLNIKYFSAFCSHNLSLPQQCRSWQFGHMSSCTIFRSTHSREEKNFVFALRLREHLHTLIVPISSNNNSPNAIMSSFL